MKRANKFEIVVKSISLVLVSFSIVIPTVTVPRLVILMRIEKDIPLRINLSEDVMIFSDFCYTWAVE